MSNATIIILQMDTMNVSNYGRFYASARLAIPQNNLTANYEFSNVAEVNKIVVVFGTCKDRIEKNKGILVVVSNP